MTTKEAREIENICDALTSHYLKEECTVSWALSSRLKIEFDGNYININKDMKTVDYICYTGDYNDLQEHIEKIVTCIAENQTVFGKLFWSYDHMRDLDWDD